jgi:putative acetyltransferase
MNTSVRLAVAEDAAAVRDVNQHAFAGPVEARIVDALRDSPDSISLVAIVDQQVVGHILFTPVTIDPPPAGVRVAGLAPMSVRPDFQRLGVGRELIRVGFGECRRHKYSAVVVVGHPEYYPRFGFLPADTWGLQYVDPVPREVFMATELERGALTGCAGLVRFRPEFAEGE